MTRLLFTVAWGATVIVFLFSGFYYVIQEGHEVLGIAGILMLLFGTQLVRIWDRET